MHAHFGDPLIIDENYFKRLTEGKVGTVIQEGYRIFDLDNPTKVYDISGTELGRVQVKRTIHTKISDLGREDIRLTKAAGFKSKEYMVRDLESIFGKKIKWITFVRFVPIEKLVNREHSKLEEK